MSNAIFNFIRKNKRNIQCQLYVAITTDLNIKCIRYETSTCSNLDQEDIN